MTDYQLAATELALLHKRADRGVADQRWFVTRRDSLLELMSLARQAFLRTPPRRGAARPPAVGGPGAVGVPAAAGARPYGT